MKSDIRGTSACPRGEEQYEPFFSRLLNKEMIQYDYRTPGGALFSCVSSTLENCRARRDAWLEKRKEKIWKT